MIDIGAVSLVTKTTLDQIKAANPSFSVWASANAGAGKTKVLIDRIARLLLNGTPPEKILAVTYTKAAAAEMTTRLFETLGEWAIAEDEYLKQKLIKLDEKLSPNLADARALFARALETPGGLKIETIHAFCGNILKRFPLEAGVPPGFEVIEDIGAKILFENAFENLLDEKGALLLRIESMTYGEKHKELLRAAIDKLGSDFVFDREKINQTINELFGIDENDTPEIIKARAMAAFDKELLLECAKILGESDKKTDLGTSDALMVIANSSAEIGFDIPFSFIFTQKGERRESSPLTKKYENNHAICRLFGEPVKKGENWIGGQLAQFWQIAQKVQALVIKGATLDLLEAASILQSNYASLKRAAGKLDFVDLLSATRKLLNQENGGALWVLYKLDQGLAHVLIDESQDTSDEQWQLLTPLLDALESETYDRFAKGPRTRFIVGDDKQSIYSFQGASPERFKQEQDKFISKQMDLASEFSVPRLAIPFEVSFRTGQDILNIVDRVWDNSNNSISLNPEDPELEVKFLDTRKHHSSRKDEATQFELWPVEMSISGSEEREAWDFPLNSDYETSAPNLLATRIAREIKARIDRGELVWDKDANNQPFARKMVESDIMILVKQRKALFYSIIRKLKSEGLNVAGADQIELSQDPAIIDLVALGRFVLRPEDDFNLACVLKGAFCGLLNDDEHLFPLAHGRGPQTLWQRLKESQNPVYDHAKRFLIEQTNRLQDANPFEFFAKLLDSKLPNGKTGWCAIIERFGNEAREPIEVFLDTALKADSLGAPDFGGFLDIIEFKAPVVKRDLNGQNQGIKVMTVHASKGREANIVILPDTTRAVSSRSNGLYFDEENQLLIWAPQLAFKMDYLEELKKQDKAKAEDEDKRLLYVAMTRARDRLIVCGHHHKKNDKKEYADGSWYSLIKNTEPFFGAASERKLEEIPGFQTEIENALVWGDDILASAASTPSALVENTRFDIPKWFDEPPVPDISQLRRIAPSMLRGEEDDEVFISPNNNQNRFLRGKIIHELLEGFSRIGADVREKWATNKLGRYHDLTPDAKSEIINHALGIVNNKDFAPYFGKNSRAEVSIMGRSKLLPNDMIVSGTLDRLILNESEVLVLDFKTNRPPPKTAQTIPQLYINQMAAYYALLSETYPNHKVKCALLWTDTPILMELSQEQIDAALRAIK